MNMSKWKEIRRKAAEKIAEKTGKTPDEVEQQIADRLKNIKSKLDDRPSDNL